MNTLKTEVLNIFYKQFVKAITECWKEGRELKIIKETPTEINSVDIEVSAKNPVDFYHLGRKFGQYKSEV